MVALRNIYQKGYHPLCHITDEVSVIYRQTTSDTQDTLVNMYQKKRLVSAHLLVIPTWNLPNKTSVGIWNGRDHSDHRQVARSPGFAISPKHIHHEQPTSSALPSTTAAIPLQRATAIQPAVRRRRRQWKRRQRALQSLRGRPKAEEIVSRTHGKFIAINRLSR